MTQARPRTRGEKEDQDGLHGRCNAVRVRRRRAVLTHARASCCAHGTVVEGGIEPPHGPSPRLRGRCLPLLHDGGRGGRREISSMAPRRLAGMGESDPDTARRLGK